MPCCLRRTERKKPQTLLRAPELSALLAEYRSLAGSNTHIAEGEHYKVLDTPRSHRPTVDYFFSFYAPNCYSLEPIIHQLKAALPEGTLFQREHVSFIGGRMGVAMSKAYATMFLLQVEAQMVPVMFKQIHTIRRVLRDEADIRSIFSDQGFSPDKFDAYAAASMAQRYDKQFQNAGLSGIPAIVVNNRYLVVLNALRSPEELIEVVHYLLQQ